MYPLNNKQFNYTFRFSNFLKIWKWSILQVDFVTIKNGEIAYFQVSDDISSQATLERELKPLLKIRDSHPKYLIANTGHPTTDYDGIKILDLKAWLSSQE